MGGSIKFKKIFNGKMQPMYIYISKKSKVSHDHEKVS